MLDGAKRTTKRSEGSSPSDASIAPQTCIRSIREDHNHDAVMRIGGEDLRRRAHSLHRMRLPGHRHLGSSKEPLPPLRQAPNGLSTVLLLTLTLRAGAKRPPGISPVVTMRHSAMRSLRARATIIVLRKPPRQPLLLSLRARETDPLEPAGRSPIPFYELRVGATIELGRGWRRTGSSTIGRQISQHGKGRRPRPHHRAPSSQSAAQSLKWKSAMAFRPCDDGRSGQR